MRAKHRALILVLFCMVLTGLGFGKSSTSITLTSSLNPSTYGSSVTFTASVTPATATGKVKFVNGSTTLGTETLSGGLATYSTSTLPAGANSITVSYGGDANDNSSTSSALIQTVNTVSTTTTLTSSANPSTYGSAVTFTATVVPSTAKGTVTFLDGSTTLGTGTLSGGLATYRTSTLTAGANSITASYGGNANYNSSTSSALTQTVDTASTKTKITSSANPSTYGSPVTFTATVAPSTATGTVTFMDGSSTLGTGTLNSGQATFSTSTLAVGSNSITAAYGGDSNHNSSTSSKLNQTVNKATSTVTLSSSANPSAYGASVTFTATVVPSTATGTVTFMDGGTALGTGTLSSGQATFSTSTLAVGSNSITAAYGGDSNDTSGTSSTLTQTVKATSTVTLSSSANPSTYGASVTFTATVTPSTATGTVTFMDGGTALGTGTLSSGQATFSTSTLAVGSNSITAAYGGDSNDTSGTSSTLTQTVNPAAPTLVSIAVTPVTPSFALGTTQQLTATGTYTDGSTLDLTASATWTSGNSGIATVNAQGVVSGVALGNTSITAASGQINGSTTVTVTPAVLVSIAVTPAIPTLPLGTAQQFTATGTYTDGSTQNITATVQWSSDTPTTATISSTGATIGLATSVGQGTATITATSGSISGSTVLTVTAAALVTIAITPATPSIALGTTEQFTATGTYTDGSTQPLTSAVQWSSDTPTTATISSTGATIGLATSVGQGTATITATAGSISGSTILTVTAAALVSIAINPQQATIPLGTTQQFTATGTYTDGSTQDLTQSGHWSSTAATVATISNTVGTAGLASTLGTGTTTIGISSGTVSATATLVVNPAALVSIAINPQSATIALGTTEQFAATGTYTDGSTQDLTSVVTWASSNATIAIISNSLGSYGLATSSGTGTTNVTATSGSTSASTSLTVGGAVLASIAVTPANPSVPIGLTEQFTATGTFTDGSTQNLTSVVQWSSDTPTTATISSTGATIGLATSVGQGTATITATSGSISGSTVLTVTAAALVTITVTPTMPSIALGTTEQFTATGTFSDDSTQNITNSVIWSSSSNDVATISTSPGLATAVGTGATTITATSGALTDSTTLTVVALGAGMQQLASDSFTRANGSLGANWTDFLSAGSVPPQIVGNQVEPSSTGFSDAMYYGGIDWPSDQYSQAQIIALGSGAKMGPSVRVTSVSEYIGIVETLGAGNATVEIELELNGTFSTLISTSTATVLPGDYIQISAQGTTLTMNNVTRSTTLLTITDSTLAAGYPGIHLNPAGGTPSSTVMSNWSGGSMTSAPLSVSTLASDNFNRANAANLGPNWSVGSGYDFLQIVNNQMEWSSSPSDNIALEYYTALTFPSDQWSQAQVTVVTGDENGPVLRYQQSSSGASYYFYDIQQAGLAGTAYVKFYSYVNGEASLIFYDNTYAALSSSDNIRAQAQGCLISLIDVTTGVLLDSYCDTSSSALSGGSPGWSIQQWGNGVSAATNWSGGTFGQ